MMKLEEYLNQLPIDEDAKREVLKLIEQARRERSELQAKGISEARQRGVQFGRPRVDIPNIELAHRLYSEHRISVSEAAQMCGVPRSTMYRRLCEYAEEQRTRKKAQ